VVVLSIILYVSFGILNISTAGLLLLLFLFNRMIPLFNSVQQNFQEWLNALPAFAGVMGIQARCEAAAEQKVERLERIELKQGLRFEGVSFAYDKRSEPLTITKLDLLIPAGGTTVIVGPSGAGKSTLADLAIGLILPDQGRILIDGVPLDAARVRSWRSQIGYVSQDTFLFNDTVHANLLWARPEATDEEIDRALLEVSFQ
jgi:ATP-binding cassette subfamily C protein